MAEQVTLSQQTATLKSAFNAFDTKLREMLTSVDEALDILNNQDFMSLQEMFDIVVAAEFLIVRVRSKILSELSRIQCVLSSTTSTAGVEKLFKDRYNYIISMCQRINELREDFSVIQRSMLARTNGRLCK